MVVASFLTRRNALATRAALMPRKAIMSLRNDEEQSQNETPVRRFRTAILQAAGWTLGGYVAVQFLRIASSLILTRLLVPEMFGIMAIATMVQVSVAMLSDVGLRPAAIQSPMGGQKEYLDTAWTLQFIHGLWICLVCLVAAVFLEIANRHGMFPAGSVYTDQVLPAVIAGISITTVITGLQSAKIITAYRDLTLSRVTAIELAAQIVGVAVAVVLAWQTRSIWSFVIAAICSAVVSTILSFVWLPGPGNRFALDPTALKDLVRFGKWVLLSSSFTVLAANGDRLLLAGWTTPMMLGLYILAFNLVAMLEGAGSRLFSSVAMPALSKVYRDDPDRLPSVFSKLRIPFDVTFVAAAGATYAAAEAIIAFLYDSRYAGAVEMLKILSFSLLLARYGLLASVYLAIGKPGHLTLLNLVRTISIFTVLPLGYYLFGFDGAIWAVALHGLPGALLLFYFHARHGLNSLRLELALLLAWPLGFLAGQTFAWLLALMQS